jgi:hypothetical protein
VTPANNDVTSSLGSSPTLLPPPPSSPPAALYPTVTSSLEIPLSSNREPIVEIEVGDDAVEIVEMVDDDEDGDADDDGEDGDFDDDDDEDNDDEEVCAEVDKPNADEDGDDEVEVDDAEPVAKSIAYLYLVCILPLESNRVVMEKIGRTKVVSETVFETRSAHAYC